MLNKNEINKDFYCSAERYENSYSGCRGSGATCCANMSCPAYHRKHPTPEQYKEEYGRDYSDNWAVWVLKKWKNEDDDNIEFSWFVETLEGFKRIHKLFPDCYIAVVCACTPYGKPDGNWRPE